MNPHGEAQRLGISLFEGTISGEISGDPVQPLTFNRQLYEVALAHSQDMIDREYFAHESPDALDPFDRIRSGGYNYSSAGENLAFRGSTGPLDEVATILANTKTIITMTGMAPGVIAN